MACSKPEDIQPDVLGATTENELNPQRMLELVNQYRTQGCTCGTTRMLPVPPLTWNNKLERAAIDHSKDMRDNNYFSHTSLDGTRFTERITRAGYQFNAAGENIARGQTSEQAVVDSWIRSEGHCRNIMSGNFTEIGAGRSGNYWTQVFARPR
ncbi:CAP domain-containing protein [Eisenibacter elegans]|jgi:uncharacterized protein YkwD|uniref:CAP domain-containing protein n=1 Tax=Eisenibacter elegans TaxID=997 RepID=UPI001B7FAF5F|nr:CAP domain-containing protein [Eisenibacter elegans]